MLTAYPWPGNVRQLRNVVENMVVLAGEAERLTVDDLPPEIHSRPGQPRGNVQALAGISLIEGEKELIRNTLKMLGGNRTQAASILGIGERSLYRKIRDYGLED